jgi:hypothetical protein
VVEEDKGSKMDLLILIVELPKKGSPGGTKSYLRFHKKQIFFLLGIFTSSRGCAWPKGPPVKPKQK